MIQIDLGILGIQYFIIIRNTPEGGISNNNKMSKAKKSEINLIWLKKKKKQAKRKKFARFESSKVWKVPKVWVCKVCFGRCESC